MEGLTEEQIKEIFSTAGQVNHFRLVYDKDTGRPKGFGFLEFADPDSAATAVRNLDQHEVMGRRLRVDYTNESGASEGALNNNILPSGATDGAQQPSTLPPLPTGQDLPPGVSCSDAISRTLAAVPGPQLLDILSSMKGVVASEPQKATELLSRAPQLSYAIFQSLLLLGLVDTTVLQSVLGQAQQSQPTPTPASMPLGGSVPPSGAPPYGAPPTAYGGGPSTMTPPVQNAYPQQPPPPPPPMGGAPDQEALIQRLMSMSQQEVDALDPMTRSQVQQLRQRIMAGQG